MKFPIPLISRGTLNRLLHGKSKAPPKPKRSRRTANQVSDPILHAVWVHVREIYFPDRVDLDQYKVNWSTRKQRRVLASCNISQKRVIVARELNLAGHARWWQPLLYHEMCHAYLGEGIERNRSRRLWHGPEFRSLESRHPEIKAMNLWIKTGGWYRAVLSDRARRRKRL